MIKCEVEVCARITRSARVRETVDGSSFLSFGIQLPITGRNGKVKMLNVSVSIDGDKSDMAMYATGRRVRILGFLTVLRKNNVTYFNLRADGGAAICPVDELDMIEGEMEFAGKISKKGVESGSGSKGDFKAFSAFSACKTGDDMEFTWVRFLYTSPKEDLDFLKENAYVKVKGRLHLGVFNDDIVLDCNVTEVAPWELKKRQTV